MIPDKSRTPDFSGGSTGSSDDDLVLVLTTWPVGTPVEPVADALVREGLAACVSILPPQRSIYRWQGRVEAADEQQLLIKTTQGRVPALEQAVHQAHPYDVPEFLVLGVEAASRAYGAWVQQTVDGRR